MTFLLQPNVNILFMRPSSGVYGAVVSTFQVEVRQYLQGLKDLVKGKKIVQKLKMDGEVGMDLKYE